MAYALSANLPHLNGEGFSQAWLAGVVDSAAPMVQTVGNVFPWQFASYDQLLTAPPSGYGAVNAGEKLSQEAAAEEIGTSKAWIAEYGFRYAASQTAWATMPLRDKLRNMMLMGIKVIRFFERFVAAKINNAEGATTTIDGEALGSNSHPLAAGTQDNLVNAALSPSTYQTAVEALMSQVDHRGEIQGGMPTHLLTAVDAMVLGAQVLGASFTAADDRTKINPLRGSAQQVVSADLATGSWSLYDMPQWQAHGALPVPVTIGPDPREGVAEEDGSMVHYVQDRISCAFADPADHRGCVIGNT